MKVVAFDIETTGLHFKKHKLLCLSAHDEDGNDQTILLTPASDLTSVITKYADYAHVWHNGKFDLKFLSHEKLRLDEDTYLLASLRPYEQRNLLYLIKLYFPKNKEHIQLLETIKDNASNIKHLSTKDLLKYCLLDSRYTYKLWKILIKILTPKEKKFYYTYLLPAARMLLNTEKIGVRLNMIQIKNLHETNIVKQEELLKTMRLTVQNIIEPEEKKWMAEALAKLKKPKNLTGKAYKNYLKRYMSRQENPKKFNWDSNKQLLWLLHDQLKLNPTDYKGKLSVSEAALAQIKEKHPIIENILKYRHLFKLQTAFLERWLTDNIDGVLYTNYDVTGTRTGRLSSSNPNLQQVPRDADIRALFVARPNHKFIISDYAQIEPRVAAYYTQDPALEWIFEQNMDLYKQVSLDIFNKYNLQLRQLSKIITLAMFYGAGAEKLRWIIKNKLNINFSLDECRDIVYNFHRAYRKLDKFKEKLNHTLKTRNGVLYNLYGRPLFLKPEQWHTAFNTLLQSTASDICLFSQLAVLNDFKKFSIQGNLILLVHDECVYEININQVAKAQDCIRFNLENAAKSLGFRIPLKIEQTVADTWKK